MKKLYTLLLSVLLFSISSAQIPAGYYNGTATLTGPALKTKLSQIISTGTVDNGYSGLWTAYATTDRDNFFENDGTILDIYSENPLGPDPYNFTLGTNQCGTYSVEGNCYNREHIVPQSLFAQASPMRNDIHFIRATDGKVNGERSNYPFGIVGTPTFTSLNGSKVGNSVSPGYGGTVFEPINAFKGDVARMVLYFVTRYESQLSSFNTGNILGGSPFPGLQNWELQQMLLWNAQDPVSPEELSRNNASYTVQGNRNPFIDDATFANLIWGSLDAVAPTAATNLVASNPTSSTVDLSWTAATDNVAVTGYEIYVNNVLKTTVAGTTAVVTGLSPSTMYAFTVIAKDAAGNSSAVSNVANQTTLAGAPGNVSCGTEDFETIPVDPNSYATRTWTNNAITWTATDARTDQTINNKAITIRNGSLTSTTVNGGVKKVTISTQLKFAGTPGTFTLYINGAVAGTIPYGATATTTVIDNLSVVGDAVFQISNNSTSTNRVALDDFTWECFTLSTAETSADQTFSIYPNPVVNNILFVKGTHLNKIETAEIYNAAGLLVQKIIKPFANGNSVKLNNLTSGIYFIKTGENSTKFIVK